jgi:hypothetical protein
VIAAFAKYEELIARLNRSAIRSAIENHALISRDDPVLLELLCTFRAIEILRNQGWQGYEIDLMEGGKVFSGVRGSERLALYYQRTPKDLREGSIYREVQKAHAFPGVGELRPDLVIELHDRENNARWILLEVKGVDRPVEDSARAALQDLLGYRRAFEPILSNQNGVYGIGAAWGEVVEPAHEGEILLCSPDTLASAIATATGAMSASAANS